MEDIQVGEEMNLAAIKNRALKGVVFLSGRMFLLQAISFFGFFFLTVFLGKEEIGLFFAVSEIVAILGYFSDVGLAAALIQSKEKPTTQEIRSTFTIQQVLVLSLLAIVIVLTPWLKNFYQINDAGIKVESIIKLPLYDFPNWQVLANGKPVEINHQNELGLISFRLEAGSYQVEVRLKNTPIRTAGNLISLLAWLSLIFYLLKRKLGNKNK